MLASLRHAFLVSLGISLTFVAVLVSGCARHTSVYDFSRLSPDATYKLSVQVKTFNGPDNRERENGSLQFTKGGDVIHSQTWTDKTPTLKESKPVAEWVANNVARFGKERADQPFSDQIKVTNTTNEKLRYVSIDYGDNETFWMLEVPSGNQMILQASPEFRSDGSSNSQIAYSGTTESGRSIKGALEGKRRQSQADGPLTFDLNVK